MYSHFYLLRLQFLGFRYHGWAKQKDLKTGHLMLDKTLQFVFGHADFKTLGSSRTDALVSAQDFTCELFLKAELKEWENFVHEMNRNLPPDIRLIDISEVDQNFNIIGQPKVKEYIYLFASGQKPHPFSAALLYTHPDPLDIGLMQQAAQVFEGTHNFRKYCARPSKNKEFEREILRSEIIPNTFYSASFFPEPSFAYRIRSRGFMRQQVRLMMGQLFEAGTGKKSPAEIAKTLSDPPKGPLRAIAPASGLILHRVEFE